MRQVASHHTVTMARKTIILLVLVALCAVATGCIIRYHGQEQFALDPDMDLWIHHPQGGSNSVEMR